jgi:protocatechuate 3,4-dioxygenase beta subunit
MLGLMKGDTGLERRATLRLLGAAGVVTVIGCGEGKSVSPPAGGGARPGSTLAPDASPAATADATATAIPQPPDGGTLACVVRPEQTEGPFFVDEKLDRSDIRSDPGDGTVKEGVPLQLVLRVYQIDGAACAPLAGAIVDVWQCDALGVYSDAVSPGLFDTRGKKFLRGFQTTDQSGAVTFVAVYPGWYPGRAVHGHFKIRGDAGGGRRFTFTSQYYFADALTDQVHAQAPYAGKPGRRALNAGDAIFRDGGGSQLVLDTVRGGAGYVGTLSIGLKLG